MYVPRHLVKNTEVAEAWLGQNYCTHYDHDDENVWRLLDCYGFDYWEALSMIQASRKLKGIRHTCRDQFKSNVREIFGKRFELERPVFCK
tara:strand:+ start:4021 stop:4290 length:270 start_codon:yes stop_codon:yes gene_type:complete